MELKYNVLILKKVHFNMCYTSLKTNKKRRKLLS
jgi:hypothetical protein